MKYNIDAHKYMEKNYDGNIFEQGAQMLQDASEAVEIAKEVEKLFEENEKRKDQKHYLVDGAVLTCNQATLRPFEMSNGTKIPLQFSNDEVDDKRDMEGGPYAWTGKDKRLRRLYTQLRVYKSTMQTRPSYHATVVDRMEIANIPHFRCNCKLQDDRKWETERIENHLEDCKKEGVCKYLMELEERWENLPRLEDDFYDTKEVIELSEVGPGEKKQTVKKVPCITMTSMLFCKHGGLITPVKSGQSRAIYMSESGLKIKRASEKLINNIIKEYEGKSDEDGNTGLPELEPYYDVNSNKTIGWGHKVEKNEKFVFSNGMEVNLDQVTHIEVWQAQEILEADIRIKENEINYHLEMFGIADKLNQQFYDALFDLCFNSKDVLVSGTDMYEFLQEENFEIASKQEIMEQFGEYTSGLNKGIMARRLDELDIIFIGKYERNNEEDVERYGDIWRKKSESHLDT